MRIVTTTFFILFSQICLAQSNQDMEKDKERKLNSDLQIMLKNISMNIQKLSANGVVYPHLEKEEKTNFENTIKVTKSAIDAISTSVSKNPITLDDQAYYDSIKYNSALIIKLQRREVKESYINSAFLGISEDIITKSKFEEKLKNKQLRRVKVIASTVRSNKATPGFLVWYVPRGWINFDDHFNRFPEKSTPSEYSLPPGAFMFWTSEPDMKDKKSEKTKVLVGANGETEMKIDIPAPAILNDK